MWRAFQDHHRQKRNLQISTLSSAALDVRKVEGAPREILAGAVQEFRWQPRADEFAHCLAQRHRLLTRRPLEAASILGDAICIPQFTLFLGGGDYRGVG